MSYLRPHGTQTPQMWLPEQNPSWLTGTARFFHGLWSPGQRSHIQKAATMWERAGWVGMSKTGCVCVWGGNKLGSRSVTMALAFMDGVYFAAWTVNINYPGWLVIHKPNRKETPVHHTPFPPLYKLSFLSSFQDKVLSYSMCWFTNSLTKRAIMQILLEFYINIGFSAAFKDLILTINAFFPQQEHSSF